MNVSFICLFARTTLKITPRHGCALLHDDLAGNCATIFSLFSTLGYFLSLFFFWFYFTTSRLERELLSTVPCFMDCYIRRTLVSHARDLYLYIPSMLFVVIQIEQVELLPVRVKLNELVFRAIFRIIMRSGSNALCNRHLADYPYDEKLVLRVLPKIKFLYKKKVWRKFVRYDKKEKTKVGRWLISFACSFGIAQTWRGSAILKPKFRAVMNFEGLNYRASNKARLELEAARLCLYMWHIALYHTVTRY